MAFKIERATRALSRTRLRDLVISHAIALGYAILFWIGVIVAFILTYDLELQYGFL